MDDDTGEIIPIKRTFIREPIVPIGFIDNFEEHAHIGIGNILENWFHA